MTDPRQAHIDTLLQRLRETTVELRAELGSEVDMVLEPTGATPVLLHDTYRTLQESEARYHALYAEMEELYRVTPIGLCALDRELRFVRINERLAAINGLSVEAHLGHRVAEIVPNLAAELQPIYRAVLERGESFFDVEIHGKTPKEPDRERDWTANYVPRRNTTGEVIGLLVAVQEITERKQVDEERERLLAEQYATLNAVADGLIIYNARGEIVRINPAADAMLHFTAAQRRASVQERWASLRMQLPDGTPFPLAEIPASIALRGQTVLGKVLVFPQPDGTLLWVSASAAPVYTAHGDLLGVVSTFTDITACGLSHFSSRVSALPLSPEQRPVMKGTMAG